MQYKTTSKLFRGIYRYKIVLVCAGAALFRNKNWDHALAQLQRTKISGPQSLYPVRGIKTQDELDYAFKLYDKLTTLPDLDIRVESPWISIYTNTNSNIVELSSINEGNVKYISAPPDNVSLNSGTIVMPKVDFEYRVTLGKTTTENSAFVHWASSNNNLKLTKSCIRDLNKHRSWGGTHFYVTGDKNLLVARMHLGGAISKVERIIKA